MTSLQTYSFNSQAVIQNLLPLAKPVKLTDDLTSIQSKAQFLCLPEEPSNPSTKYPNFSGMNPQNPNYKINK